MKTRKMMIGLFGCTAASASASNISWLAPVSGNWSDATKWTGGVVPNSPQDVAQISTGGSGFTVSLDMNATVGGLLISSTDGFLSVLSGNTLTIAGSTWSVGPGFVRVNNGGRVLSTVPSLVITGPAGPANGSLNLNGGLLTTSDPSYVITLAGGHRILGGGGIDCAFVNQGRVEPTNGGTISFSGGPITNRNLMLATNLAGLVLSNVDVDNAGGLVAGRLTGGVTVRNSNFTGGTLEGGGPVQSGPATTQGVSRYTNVQFLDGHAVDPGGRMIIMSNTLLGDVQVWVNRLTSTTPAVFSAAGPTLSIPSQILTLDANAADIASARLEAEAPATVMTVGGTLRGNGQVLVDTVHSGRVAPGHVLPQMGLVGQIDVGNYAFALTPIATLETHLHGTAVGQYDRLTGMGAITLDGFLSLQNAVGFTPSLRDEFPIVTGASVTGRFAGMTNWITPAGHVARVRYRPTSATVVFTCQWDLDGDYFVDFDDLALMLSQFGTNYTLQGLADLLAVFGTPCQ